MEKLCEFCKRFNPLVYCKADAAYLCLGCDIEVHSANAIAFNHPRTIVCELCGCSPAEISCPDHKMFMCRICDSGHGVSCQNTRRTVGYYTGCPSALELAALWQLDLSETKVVEGDNRMQGSFLIPQQIEEMDSEYTMKEHKSLSSSKEYFGCGEVEGPFSSNLLQIDNPFWQCKNPVQNNEIWMQDIGLCEDTGFLDDVEIPDVDFRFENFNKMLEVKHETSEAVDEQLSVAKLDQISSGSSSTIQAHQGKSNVITNTFDQHKTIGDHLPLGPESGSSFSISRSTNESRISKYNYNGHSLSNTQWEDP